MAGHSILPIFIPHAGCPNDCVFCNQRAISGQLSLPTPQDVFDEVTAALARLDASVAPELAFYGGSFTAIPPEAQTGYLQAVQPFLADSHLSSVRVSTRPDAIDAETLRRLSAFGVQTIELGAQSMDDAVLRLARRGHTAGDTVRAAQLIQAAGFSLILQMMVGLPGDSPASVLATGRAIAALRPDGVRIYPVAVLRGTALAELAANGAYQPLALDDATEQCAELIALFSAAGIPIIRIGLNPSESLHADVLAGAYHPALGELCYARWYRKRMCALAEPLMPTERLVFFVHPARLSVAAGQHRSNLAALRAQFPALKAISLYGADGERDAIRVERG